MTERERKMVLLKNGICPKCGKPNNGTGVQCEECAGRQRERYNRRKEIRVCVDCKKPLTGKTIRCDKCNERRNAWYRKQYWDCINNGICTKCQKYTAAPGRTMCEVCLAKSAERARRKRIGQKRKDSIQKS